MSIDVRTVKEQTAEAFAHPATGDCFQEMYSFWMGVLAVHGDYITYVTKAGHYQGDGPTEVGTIPADEWRSKFSYNTPGLGYWVLLAGHNRDIADWLAS